MAITDIIKQAAFLLGKDDVATYLGNGECVDQTTAAKDATALLGCYNLVLNEVATEYVPLIKKQRLTATDGKVYFSALDFGISEVAAVYDDNMNRVECDVYADRIETELAAVYIEYYAVPPVRAMTDAADYPSGRVPDRVFAYGVAAEFCISNGVYEEAEMWQERFQQSIVRAAPKSRRVMKPRRWF